MTVGTARAESGRTIDRSWRLAGLLYLIATFVYVADRVAKVVAENQLQGRPPIKLIPGALQLNFTTNRGGAFGLFGNAPWLFLGATLLVCAVIAVASLRLTVPMLATGLGMVLGGALGNLTDRVIRGEGLNGRVIDFIDFRIWPVFNLADAAIVIGAALILVAGLRRATAS